MMTEARCFRGATLQDAVSAARAAFGPAAVIIRARAIPARGWRGLVRRFDAIEIEASPPVARPRPRLPRRPPDPPAVRREDPATQRAILDSLRVPAVAAPVPIQVRPGSQRLVAVVGPTGAGKTTTVAKLAAQLHLRQGWKVGLITADTFRVGAVQQLHDYARLISVPLEVASTPPAFVRALGRMAEAEVVLIDTSGRGHRDRQANDERRAYLAAARDVGQERLGLEVHLVLAAPTRRREVEAILGTYQDLEPRLLVTKLDECEGLPDALAVAAERGMRLSYCTFGQRVPEDIALGWPDRFVAAGSTAAPVFPAEPAPMSGA